MTAGSPFRSEICASARQTTGVGSPSDSSFAERTSVPDRKQTRTIGVMVFAPNKLFARRRSASLPCLGMALGLLMSVLASNTAKASPRSLADEPAPQVQRAPATQTRPTSAQSSPAQVPALTPAQQGHALKVQELIKRAEASYASGVNNYNGERLDAARTDFDTAVDLMLASGMDLKNDPELSEEFEHLLDRINSLENLALKQGNGFSPKIEEAPIENATDITFAPNPELVARLTSELSTASDLPLVINDQVAGYIGVFSTSNSFRAHMSASMQRLGRYRTLIQNVLKEEGVPQDLIYLAVAESGFQPQVVNYRSGAGGMWQFMTYTGPEYGLTRNGYFDYRFDPEKSSRAYARYMKKLYALFNDWNLAMAAYDWGPGNIQRVVSRSGYADYWELYRRNMMPAETRAYVPKILAAVIMAKNPEKYGLNRLPPSPPVIYDTVTVSNAVSLNLVADLTDSTVSELTVLNPALLRLSTPRDIDFDLHLPPGTKDTFSTRLKDIPQEDRSSWRFHVVKTGETLEGIAGSFHASADSVAAYNDVTAAKPIEAGDELVIPIVASGARQGQQRYTVHRGDTLLTVADRFGITVEQLHEWNAAAANRLTPGRSLYVAEPVRLAPSARGRSSRGYARGRNSSAGRVSRASASRHTAKAAGPSGSSAKSSAHHGGSSSHKHHR